MPLPKRRHSKSRRDKGRTHQKLTNPSITLCPQCHQPKLPHIVCPYCGYYKGKQVLVIEEKKKKEKK